MRFVPVNLDKNSDFSVCKGTYFQRILLQKLCQTCFSYQRLTFLTASMYLFQYKRTKSRFGFSMNNPLKHVSYPIFLLSLSSIMEHTHEGRKEGRKNECAITQHFEVTEHEQSAKSCLKKCKFTVKKCLVRFRQKGCFGA